MERRPQVPGLETVQRDVPTAVRPAQARLAGPVSPGYGQPAVAGDGRRRHVPGEWKRAV